MLSIARGWPQPTHWSGTALEIGLNQRIRVVPQCKLASTNALAVYGIVNWQLNHRISGVPHGKLASTNALAMYRIVNWPQPTHERRTAL